MQGQEDLPMIDLANESLIGLAQAARAVVDLLCSNKAPDYPTRGRGRRLASVWPAQT
jgi:hypothetical protein